MIAFSAIFNPTALFSLKDSKSTNSGAKSLMLPTPYSIKMAILNQAITVGNELEDLSKKNSEKFSWVRDTIVGFHIPDTTAFCVNNTFVKILKPSRSGAGFQETVSFREYVQIGGSIEIILEVPSETARDFWQKYFHKVNYFGKRGCFFQFVEYCDSPSTSNVVEFKAASRLAGIIQSFDDFDRKVTFEMVNNFRKDKTTKRTHKLMLIPISQKRASKSYTQYIFSP